MNCVNAETLKRNHLESKELKLKSELWRVQSELYNMEHNMPPLPKREKGPIEKAAHFVDKVFTAAFAACASLLVLAFLWFLASALIEKIF